jgi:hypothetical protein
MKTPFFKAVFLAIALIYLSGAAYASDRYSVPNNNRIEKTINTEWVFNYFPEAESEFGGYENPLFDDSKWSAIAVPHTWQTYETTRELHPYIHSASVRDDPYWWNGWGWYRKRIVIGEELRGKKITFEFDGVQKYSKVFLNGVYLGDHKGGYTGFYLDATDAVKFGEENVLVVVVHNALNDRYNIPPMNAGNWVVYGGITRDVRIVATDKLNVPYQGSYKHEGGTFITTPQVNKEEATVNVKSYIQNLHNTDKNVRIVTVITNSQNEVLNKIESSQTVKSGEIAEFVQETQVSNPNLWTPETPYIYNLYTEVYDGTRLTDVYNSTFGIRSIEWCYERSRLILNGEVTQLHGINRHEEYIWLGHAFPKWIGERDMRDIKYNLEMNYMRTAHYPNCPSIYDFTDRHGILLCVELPKIKRQKFDEEVKVNNTREMIRRFRNHPSIILWSMGNETDDAADGRYAWEEDQTRILTVRQPYSEAYNPEYVIHTDREMPVESFLRCTIRGWYDKNDGLTPTDRNTEPADHQWAGTDYWQHYTSRQRSRGPISEFNGTVWLYADHGADRIYTNAPLKYVNPKGWVDSWRTPKYVYHLWRANFAKTPMVHIQPHFWTERFVGTTQMFTVDSNCETVELFVNGRSMGKKTPLKEEHFVLEFMDIPVERGTIEVVGTHRDGTVVRDKVVMAGNPARLVVKASHEEMMCSPDNVIEFWVNIVDSDGVHVYGANPPLRFTVDGPAQLIGSDMYVSDREKNRAGEGTMYIDTPVTNLIRAIGKPGEVTFTVTAPGLESASVTINVTPRIDTNPVRGITEPRLNPEGRKPIQTNPSQASVSPPEEMKFFTAEITFPKEQQPQFRELIKTELLRLYPNINPNNVEFQLALDGFVDILNSTVLYERTRGYVVTDDLNFVGAQYNLSRAITTYLQQKNLPQAWIDEMTRYYANIFVVRGYSRNYINERELLDRIPVGGTAIYIGTGSGREGVIEIDDTDLRTLLPKIHSQFASWASSDQGRALMFITAINPPIIRTRPRQSDDVFTIERGRVILIPDLETLREARFPDNEQL